MTKHAAALAALCCLVLASSAQALSCTDSCGYGLESYTWCHVAYASIDDGWTYNTYTCPYGAYGAGNGNNNPCWTYCGYSYTQSSSCAGSCSATSGRSCGSTSGSCTAGVQCTDNNYNPGSHCTGSAPSGNTMSCSTSSYTSCPVPACSTSSLCSAACGGGSYSYSNIHRRTKGLEMG
jgi:hypothetical protein